MSSSKAIQQHVQEMGEKGAEEVEAAHGYLFQTPKKTNTRKEVSRQSPGTNSSPGDPPSVVALRKRIVNQLTPTSQLSTPSWYTDVDGPLTPEVSKKLVRVMKRMPHTPHDDVFVATPEKQRNHMPWKKGIGMKKSSLWLSMSKKRGWAKLSNQTTQNQKPIATSTTAAFDSQSQIDPRVLQFNSVGSTASVAAAAV